MPPALLGLAHYLPPPQSVGGLTRPIAGTGIGASDLALEPTRQALGEAGVSAEDVELIVFATMTPDVSFPGPGCYLQKKLGFGTIGALDLRGQCAGYLMGLMIAHDYIRAGLYRTVLLAAAEVHSSGLDYSEGGAAVARLYGDGGAVTVLGNREGSAIESVVCRGDGTGHDRFWIEYPASRHHPARLTVDDLRAGRHYPQLDFEHIERFGVTHLPEVVGEALAAAAIGADDVDCFVLSHVLPVVVERSAAALQLPHAKVIAAGDRHGHLTAASLPVALSEARAAGRVGAGARVCLAACGAGYAWGAAVLTL